MMPPPLPVQINVKPETAIGDNKTAAAYTLVEFMDYQCPPCKSIAEKLPDFLKPYRGKVCLISRNLPLPMHPYAMRAALVAEAAREQGKFESIHDALIESVDLREPHLQEIVRANHLDVKRLNLATASSAKRRVSEDIRDAEAMRLNATPSFLLVCPDGRVFHLSSVSQLREVVK